MAMVALSYLLLSGCNTSISYTCHDENLPSSDQRSPCHEDQLFDLRPTCHGQTTSKVGNLSFPPTFTLLKPQQSRSKLGRLY
ncbi:hypothetical protein PF005_g32608 [Phytophthora fragariae]|uniref:RxLR effector protein n=1 Tax=Phytophthora fragariae TaxID=53985 RepID=A0A6A3VA23_9STRA|nr:hypothetical protein PF003_g32653 [Phytophthora fragariae]KAE8917491.1 hypothetical protein PF009_g32187 [Phytophthora fragariae]KAE8955926.1 hypothetical protein PF011_g31649 [Phytophthora fragariae]KAE9056093.1 hypothetical protein PF007_g32101 [Phytophthora fragariae]KAE9057794.1 hypothetical protein PF006_g32327 [Phytophthora fragariae]